MDDLYQKIQMLLMKKSQEYGELYLLMFRTTSTCTSQIEDLSDCVSQLISTHHMVSKGVDPSTDEKSVSIFLFLLLNTKFNVQERLAEDLTNGHLVDMCPSLSPYLFLQILWKLEYEMILVESILHMPLDLCVELLEITRRCIIELDHERATNIIFPLIVNTYGKFISMLLDGAQSSDITKNIKALVVNFEELLSLIMSMQTTHLIKVSELKKYQQYGLLLKNTITMVKKCFNYNKSKSKLPADIAKIYKITFGREPIQKCEESLAQEILITLNQELINLLIKRLEEINCNIYFGWAEVDDLENPMISLQKAIGNECYHFLEFMKNVSVLSENKHLIQCLQVLAAKPLSDENSSVLTLQELSHGIREGKKEYLKELLKRYKEWDQSTLDYIEEFKSLLDKEDCLYLLKYLTFVLNEPGNEEFHRRVYDLVTTILLCQNVQDIYFIVVEHITMNDARNCLELPYTEETFREFIIQHTDLKSAKNLKVLLLFLLKSPRKVLNILIRITFGYPEYENVMISAHDLTLLSPVLNIRESYDNTLLSNTLKTICLENPQWNVKKFTHFLQVMMDASILTIDDIVNNILITYLQKKDTMQALNATCMLNFVNKRRGGIGERMKTKDLLDSLALAMIATRRRPDLSKHLINEIIAQMGDLAEYFIDRNITLYHFEPIDTLYFSCIWLKGSCDILHVIQDYERRCFVVTKKLQEDPNVAEKYKKLLSNLGLFREDFLRHMFVCSIDAEYQRLASEFTLLHWFSFNYKNEVEAYENLLCITIDGCCLALEYPLLLPYDSFTFLLTSCMKFCKVFVRLEIMSITNITDVHRALLKNIRNMSESISDSVYSSSYRNLLSRLSDTAHIEQSFEALDQFIDECSELDREQSARSFERSSFTTRVSRLRKVHEFISTCTKLSTLNIHECMVRIGELMGDSS